MVLLRRQILLSLVSPRHVRSHVESSVCNVLWWSERSAVVEAWEWLILNFGIILRSDLLLATAHRSSSLQLSAAMACISVRRAEGFSRTGCDVLVRATACEVEVSIATPIISPDLSLALSLALFQSTRSGCDPRTVSVFGAPILSDRLVCSTSGVGEPHCLAALLCLTVREFWSVPPLRGEDRPLKVDSS